MAEDKSAVLLYRDIIHTVEELSDTDAGKLFKHYLRYINDKNPEPPSKLIKIVFEPIKQDLKRDLKKWEKTKGVKSDSGVMGNMKRWHPDLYEQVKAEKMELKEAMIIAERRKTSHSDKNIANVAVSVSVSDTVNDTVTVSEGKGKSHAELFAESQIWKERLCMKHKMKMDQLPAFFDEFFLHLATQGKEKQSLNEKQSYFDNWLGKQDKTKTAPTQYPYKKYNDR